MKKFISIFLSSLIFMMCCIVPIGASDASYDEYIQFTSSNARMESDGSFHFYFRTRVTSDYFTADSSTMTVTTQAHLFAQDGTKETFVTSDVSFRLTLYKKNFIGKSKVMSYIAYTDNIYGGVEVEVEKGKKYFLELECLNNLDSTKYYIEGIGLVTPVTLVD